MSTSGDSSFGGSPLQYYQTKPFSLEDVEALHSTTNTSTQYSSCKASRASNTSSQYRRTQPYSPTTSVGTPATCSSDESLPDCLGVEDNEDDSSGVASSTGIGHEHKKIRRIQANKRERKRMHTVNSAFDDLRDLVPTYPTNRKLSKIETLRLACAYIQDLAKLLNESNAAVHGEDVNLHHHHHGAPAHHYDGFMPAPQPPAAIQQQPPPVSSVQNGAYSPVKTEFNLQQPGDYNTCNFKHYRIPLSYDYESCPSDPELQSPPNYHGTVYMMPPGLAVKPPALARVSSDTAVSLQMAQASLSNGGGSSSGYCGSPAAPIAPCSPLTRVTHSSPSQASRNIPTTHFSASSSYHYNSTSFHHQPHQHHALNSSTPSYHGTPTQCYSQ